MGEREDIKSNPTWFAFNYYNLFSWGCVYDAHICVCVLNLKHKFLCYDGRKSIFIKTLVCSKFQGEQKAKDEWSFKLKKFKYKPSLSLFYILLKAQKFLSFANFVRFWNPVVVWGFLFNFACLKLLLLKPLRIKCKAFIF